MNARNRVFLILGLLTAGSLVWYLLRARSSADLHLIGTVDANEVLVSAKIPGRIQTLTVDEGQDVKLGQLIAVIESDDLEAAHKAAEASAASQKWKLGGSVETERQTRGENRKPDGERRGTGAGIARDSCPGAGPVRTSAGGYPPDSGAVEAGHYERAGEGRRGDSLQAAQAAVESARENVSAAEASLRQARAHELSTQVAARTVDSTRDEMENARALAEQAKVQVGYAQVLAPVSGKVNVRAARQGEVVAAGTPIVTVMDLTQTWVYAPLPETQADSVQVGDSLRVVMPSGTAVQGKVIAKSAEADFATQRDINGGRKRDIKTVQLKLLIDNPGEKFVPGMTADVYIAKGKLVKQ